jgi:hypothetical protein
LFELARAVRKDRGSCKAIAPEVLELAEECRKELPRRSAGLIQNYLKTQNYKVARSTLERQLRLRAISSTDLIFWIPLTPARVTHAQFYGNQKQPILEDALRQQDAEGPL